MVGRHSTDINHHPAFVGVLAHLQPGLDFRGFGADQFHRHIVNVQHLSHRRQFQKLRSNQISQLPHDSFRNCRGNTLTVLISFLRNFCDSPGFVFSRGKAVCISLSQRLQLSHIAVRPLLHAADRPGNIQRSGNPCQGVCLVGKVLICRHQLRNIRILQRFPAVKRLPDLLRHIGPEIRNVLRNLSERGHVFIPSPHHSGKIFQLRLQRFTDVSLQDLRVTVTQGIQSVHAPVRFNHLIPEGDKETVIQIVRHRPKRILCRISKLFQETVSHQITVQRALLQQGFVIVQGIPESIRRFLRQHRISHDLPSYIQKVHGLFKGKETLSFRPLVIWKRKELSGDLLYLIVQHCRPGAQVHPDLVAVPVKNRLSVLFRYLCPTDSGNGFCIRKDLSVNDLHIDFLISAVISIRKGQISLFRNFRFCFIHLCPPYRHRGQRQ